MKKTRLIIVDDEPLFRELLARSLSAEPGLEVVGVAQDGATAVRLAMQEKPDVVLMDIELQGEQDGIQAGLQIKKENPKTGIVILSAHCERRYVSSLPLDDIRGWAYLLKQTAADLAAVMRAIQGSKAGMVVLDPAVVASLQPRQGSAVARLNPRHLEVLELMAQGYDNAAIAEVLRLSQKSVETYVNAIYKELHLSGEPNINPRVKATLLYMENSRNRPR